MAPGRHKQERCLSRQSPMVPFGAMLRASAATLVGMAGSMPLISPRLHAPVAGERESLFAIEQNERAWLSISNWTIAIVLCLLLGVIVGLGVFGFSYLDVQPGHT